MELKDLRSALLAASVLGMLLLAGCGGGAAAEGVAGERSITIVGRDTMTFDPNTITVRAGESVTLVFQNAGVLPHDLVTLGGERNAKLVNVAGGKSQQGTFRATKPGTYTYICNQLGHKEGGMSGQIIVE